MEISPDEVKDKLEQGDGNFILLDCREAQELEIASIEGARHIPMGEISDRLEELDREKEIVVFCHRGQRSAQVVQFLADKGYGNVKSMSGGIGQWSMEIDPDVPMY